MESSSLAVMDHFFKKPEKPAHSSNNKWKTIVGIEPTKSRDSFKSPSDMDISSPALQKGAPCTNLGSTEANSEVEDGKLTVTQLQSLLKQRGLPIHGTKAELNHRLSEFERKKANQLHVIPQFEKIMENDNSKRRRSFTLAMTESEKFEHNLDVSQISSKEMLLTFIQIMFLHHPELKNEMIGMLDGSIPSAVIAKEVCDLYAQLQLKQHVGNADQQFVPLYQRIYLYCQMFASWNDFKKTLDFFTITIVLLKRIKHLSPAVKECSAMFYQLDQLVIGFIQRLPRLSSDEAKSIQEKLWTLAQISKGMMNDSIQLLDTYFK